MKAPKKKTPSKPLAPKLSPRLHPHPLPNPNPPKHKSPSSTSPLKKLVITPQSSTNLHTLPHPLSRKAAPKLSKQFCQQLFNWGIKSSASYAISEDKLSIEEFVNTIQGEEFGDMGKLKMKVFQFVVNRRIIRDREFENMYEVMVGRFGDKEGLVREMLVEILAALDQ